MKEEIHQFLYKQDKPKSFKILGVLAVIFSLGGLATSPVFGVIMALVAVGLLAYQNGVEVNVKERTYRMITAIGPKVFGQWQPLPAIKCVSVFKTNLVNSTYSRSNRSVTTKQTVIQVNLATEQNDRIRVFETEEIEEAFVFAKEFAQKLNLNVWDATEPQGKWLNK